MSEVNSDIMANISNKVIMNNKKAIRITILDILSGIYIMHKLIPAFGEFVPSVMYLALFVLTFAFTLYKININSNSKKIWKFSPILSVPLLYFFRYILSGSINSAFIYLYGEMQVILYGLIALAYISNSDEYAIKRMFNFIVLCYIITAYTTIIGCIKYPNAARVLATTIDKAGLEYQLYKKNNIGGFTFIYELVLLTPIFLSMIKQKKMNRILGFLIIVLFGMTIYRSEYTIAFIFYFLSVFIYFIPKWNEKRIVPSLIIVLVVILFSRPILVKLFLWLSTRIDSHTIASRMSDIAVFFSGSVIGNYGSVSNRILLYQKSWNTFLSTFGFGSWIDGRIGGHSYILDCIGLFGVLGLIAVIFTFTSIWKNLIKQYKYVNYYGYLVWAFIVAIVFALINPKLNIYYFIFILPLFIKKISQSDVEAQ